MQNSDFEDLRKRISKRGQVITPTDPDYDNARKVWNAAINKRPAAVVYCKGAADVQATVKFAAEHKIPLVVRGGGHSLSGRSSADGALIVDLSRMCGVVVNPRKKTAWAEGGCRWEDVDRETAAHGLATVGGTVSDTGVGGLAQGGGFGWLTRKHGLTVDNILAADVVLADGRLVRASENENSDLLWCIRGGAGNFGVVTAFKFRLHPIPAMPIGGFEIYSWDNAKAVLNYVFKTLPTLPRETMLTTVLACPPPVNFQPSVVVLMAHFGEPEALEKIRKSIHDIAAPVVSQIGPQPYTELQKLVNHFAAPHMHGYSTSQFLHTPLADSLADTFMSLVEARPHPGVAFIIEFLGGAVQDASADSTSFGQREKLVWQYISWTMTPDADGYLTGCEWVKRVKQEMVPFQYKESFYANYAIDGVELDQQARWAFGKSFDELAKLKQKYDPLGMFRGCIFIKPTDA